MPSNTKNAFVTIIGMPNVGKSSLLNAFVGEKIAAVSSKPQTTRTKITGVITKDETQYVFMDTPGMHKSKNKLSEHMIKTVNESVVDADIILFVTDATKKISDNEINLINSFKSNSGKSILIINKIDLLKDKRSLMKIISDYSSHYSFDEVIPVSALKGEGLEAVMKALSSFAVDGPHYFPDDMLTDQPEKVIIAETIREKALNNLNQEIPHGIAVTIESLKEHDNRYGEAVLDISAVIYCERDSHKGIIIGKKGCMLKRIGEQSRMDLEAFFEIKVNLQCWVKVKEGWRNREGMIRNFGLSSN